MIYPSTRARVADAEEKIDRVKAELAMIIKEGLITEEWVSIVFVRERRSHPTRLEKNRKYD